MADVFRDLGRAFRHVDLRWYVFGAQALVLHGLPARGARGGVGRGVTARGWTTPAVFGLCGALACSGGTASSEGSTASPPPLSAPSETPGPGESWPADAPHVPLPAELPRLKSVCEWTHGNRRYGVPAGSGADSLVQIAIEDDHLELRYHRPLRELTLGPRIEIVFGGFAIPDALTPLRPTAVSADGRVTLEWGKLAGAFIEAPLTAIAPCDALGAPWGSFDPESPHATALRQAAVPSDRRIALSREPNGATAAMLDPEAIMPNLFVMAERDGWARIEWQPERHRIFGWVRSAQLVATRPHGGDCCDPGGGQPGPAAPRVRRAGWECPGDVPLALEQGGERWSVGRARKGSVLVASPSGDPFVVVDVLEGDRWGSVLPALGAGERVVARSRDLEGCTLRGGTELSRPTTMGSRWSPWRAAH